MPRTGIRGILGGVRAPALSEVPVQRQVQLASNLALAVNQALMADGIDPEGCGERIECCP